MMPTVPSREQRIRKQNKENLQAVYILRRQRKSLSTEESQGVVGGRQRGEGR